MSTELHSTDSRDRAPVATAEADGAPPTRRAPSWRLVAVMALLIPTFVIAIAAMFVSLAVDPEPHQAPLGLVAPPPAAQAIETALADRQALLESYRQQLEDLEGRVATSSLTVTLVEPSEPVEADPAGFGDGLAAGWNGLVATLNGIVIGLGFLLPWLLVVAVVVAAVWLIVIGRRARARRRAASVAPTPEDADV